MARRSERTRAQLADLILDAAVDCQQRPGGPERTRHRQAHRLYAGPLYLVFANLDDVIVRVARAYVDFAHEHLNLWRANLWRACFEHRLPQDTAGSAFPDTRIANLVGLIMQPLANATGECQASSNRWRAYAPIPRIAAAAQIPSKNVTNE